jgi:pimeloyl-ACP methyl ester carboxylesterase
MTASAVGQVRDGRAVSRDGTVIAYHSLGSGPGLVLIGGVLLEGSDYLPLARALAGEYQVHVMERRGRPGSGPQREDHAVADECDDLVAVAAATGSEAVFGHSFGGLVALETARTQAVFGDVFVYEPGVPLRGQIRVGWLDAYSRRLDRGDRRGAFACLVKGSGFAPAPVSVMPLWYLSLALRMVIRGRRWDSMNRLLEANLTEHRAQALLDAPDPGRFSAITARTVLFGGGKGPDILSGPLLDELASVIPRSEVVILPGLDHLAAQTKPARIASAVLTAAAGSR